MWGTGASADARPAACVATTRRLVSTSALLPVMLACAPYPASAQSADPGRLEGRLPSFLGADMLKALETAGSEREKEQAKSRQQERRKAAEDDAKRRADDMIRRQSPEPEPPIAPELSLTAAEEDAKTRADTRFRELTGRELDPWWRAPGGRAPDAAMASAKSCGWAHVHWAPAGFLGDELPSERYSNEALLGQALRTIRGGDILIAHLGIWSRKDPWAPTLDPLIAGLRARGLCFATLRDHPDYRR